MKYRVYVWFNTIQRIWNQVEKKITFFELALRPEKKIIKWQLTELSQ